MVWEFLAGAVFAKMFLSGGRSAEEDQVRAGFVVKPNMHWMICRDFEATSRVRYLVKSSHPVDVHFLRRSELDAFRSNREFCALSSKERASSFEDAFVVQPGRYALLIVNWSKDQDASGLYDVWSRSA